jgi:HD-GYP domain-containing protein (c-di-GMP phosphodiesterase class II)
VRPKKSARSTNHKERLEALQDIAVELMQPRDLSLMLKLVVDKAVDLLVSDAASLYLKNTEDNLSFEVAVNRSMHFEFKKYTLPIAGRGVAAYVFRTGENLNIEDVRLIAPDSPYRFDDSFDRRTTYRTRSMLSVPLRSSKGNSLGVLQLVNRKSSREMIWPSQDPDQIREMPTFTPEDMRLLQSFAAVASAAIENAKLYTDIEHLFEGFVKASVHAIESRDSGTRGHSERVAALTVDLAENVSRSQDDGVKAIQYTTNQIAEIRYASLLHDFGKIGVREATLLKEEKLSQMQQFQIRSRLNDFKARAEIKTLRHYLEQLTREGRAPNQLEWARLERDIKDFGLQIEGYWDLILDLNAPTVLDRDKSQALESLLHVNCESCKGQVEPLLKPAEVTSLKILRGSLNEDERLEIESHVVHTVEFLKQIPWTADFSRIPEIAGAHHERLTGRGYPYKLAAPQIPDQARMMAICDIFDALVANDRPYKPAVPIEKALSILEMQCKAGELDNRFFKIFVEARIFENPTFIQLNEVKKKAA